MISYQDSLELKEGDLLVSDPVMDRFGLRPSFPDQSPRSIYQIIKVRASLLAGNRGRAFDLIRLSPTNFFTSNKYENVTYAAFSHFSKLSLDK